MGIIKVQLDFQSNTQTVKNQLKEVQSTLSSLINTGANMHFSMTPELTKARQSAIDLKTALQAATSVDTGKLNLAKFNAQLKNSGQSLQQYAAQMKMLGPEGVRAFNQVAIAISNADTKVFSLSGKLKEMAKTMGSSIQWSLAYGAINLVTQGVRNTIDYAKQLDESLTDIRVVTGYSADTMANFAAHANEAAKALKVTTNEYAKASLIYFQQGLQAAEVYERTETTLKLAATLNESAETVSNWMTAIWNNFDDGSKSLEYYADVLAKLGAATASSADEIAGGLEKFASVAEAIGLSYEYAASALATITAETRQSEDVVGTALKTIFSRMEGLKLGEALDDGTTLNQYSQALGVVGVEIKDVNGELKNMDTILQQTGERWQFLERDQKVALAQGVAGIRQYTQFMALMENWDVMQQNIEMSENAEGTLTRQYQSYAESVKASQAELTASSEKLMYSLFDADNIKDMNSALVKIVDVVTILVDSFGGLRTILLGVIAVLANKFQPHISQFITTTISGFQMMGKGAQQYKTTALQIAQDMTSSMNFTGASDSYESEFMRQQGELQETFLRNSQTMTAQGKERAQIEMEIAQAIQNQVLGMEQQVNKAKEASEAQQEKAGKEYEDVDVNRIAAAGEKRGQVKGAATYLGSSVEGLQEMGDPNALSAETKTQVASQMQEGLGDMRQAASGLGVLDENLEQEFNEISQAIKTFSENGSIDIENLSTKVRDLIEQVETLSEKKVDDIIEDEVVDQTKTGETQTDSQFVTEASRFVEKDGTARIENANDLEKQIGDVQDKTSSSMSKDDKAKLQGYKDRAKALAAERKELDKTYNSLKKKGKLSKDEEKQLKRTEKALEKNKTATKNLSKEVGKTLKQTPKVTKQVDKNGQAYKDCRKTMEQVAEGSSKTATGMYAVGKAAQQAGANTEDLKNKMNNGSFAVQSFGDKFASSLSSISSFAMGLSMLGSGIETLAEKVASGEDGFMDYVSAFSSIIPAVLMFIPIAGKAIGLIVGWRKAVQAKNTVTQLEGELETINTTLKDKSLRKDKKRELEKDRLAKQEQLREMGKQASHLGTHIAKGIAGIALATVLAGLIAMVTGVNLFSGASAAEEKEEEEVNEAALNKAQKNIENMDAALEASKNVSKLTDEYNDLVAAGKSVYETTKKLDEEIPKLAEQYRDLSSAVSGLEGMDVILEEALAAAQASGDYSQIGGITEQAEDTITQAHLQEQQNLVEIGHRQALTKADGDSDGWTEFTGDDENANYLEDSKAAKSIISGMGFKTFKLLDDGTFQFDVSTPENMALAYEEMGQALNKLDQLGGFEKTGTYKWLVKRHQLLGEATEAMREGQKSLVNYAREDWGAETSSTAQQVKATLAEQGLDLENMAIEDYSKNKDKILQALSDAYGISLEDAEELLSSNKLTKTLEFGLQLFAEDGRIARELQQGGHSELKDEIQSWFEGLSAEDRSLVSNINFALVTNMDDVRNEMENQRQLVAENKIISKATELGFDAETLEAYTDILVDENEALGENNALSKQIALNNMKLNKGLGTLADKWSNISEILAEGNRNSIEYAEAIGEIKKAFKEAFDYAPSTKYIEDNLYTIQEAAKGSTEAIEELQDGIANDYILNLDYKTTWDGEEGFSLHSIQTTLQHLAAELDNFDTSVEIGEGAHLSQDYVNTLQQMLDNGQLAEEELQQLMRMKGYELEIQGWDEVPGPESTVIQRSGNWDEEAGEYVGTITTKKITSQEMLRVPIINGNTSRIKVKAPGVSATNGETARAVRSSSGATVNASTLKKNQSSKEGKKIKDEVERYHELDRALASLERRYNRISTLKDQAFGNKRLAYIREENKAIQEQLDTLRQKQAAAKANYEIDRAALDKYGVSFGANGEITNYEEVFAAQIAQYNTDPEAYEESYAEFKELISQYEETLDTVEDLTDEILNKELEDIANKLEDISYTVELGVSLNEDDMALIEFQLEGLTDNVFDSAKRFDLMGRQMSVAIGNSQIYEQGIKDILGVSGIDLAEIISNPNAIQDIVKDKNLTADQIEQLREYRDGLMENASAMREYRDNISDILINAFEEANEEMEKFSSNIEHTSTMLEGYRNILDLAGRDALGVSDELMVALAKTQYKVAASSVQATKARLEQNQKILQDTEESLAKMKADPLVSEKDLQELEDFYDEVSTKVQEDQQALQDELSNTIETLTAMFEEEVNGIMREFENSMSGLYGNFEQMTAAMDRQKEVNERYLKDYEEIYELSKLNRDIMKSIDSNDSVVAKSKLRDIQKEINDLQASNVKMTKYEVDELRARYELRLAEIALEEAQNAKSQVRMQRDSDGNWGYVYTANQNTIATAEQAYEDKLFAYQNLTQARISEMIDLMASIPQQYSEAIRSVYEDQTLNDEERARAIAEIQQYYQDMYAFAVNSFELASNHAKQLYNEDWLKYSELTNYKISANEEWISDFDQTVLFQVAGFNTLEEAQQKFYDSSDIMLTQLHTSYSNYRLEIKNVLTDCLGDLEEYLGSDGAPGSLAYYLNEAEKSAKEQADAATQMAEDNGKAFEKMVDEASSWLITYGGVIDQWVEKTQEIADATNGVAREYANLWPELQTTAGQYWEVERAARAAMEAQGKQIAMNNAGYGAIDKITLYSDKRQNRSAGLFTITGSEAATIQYVDGYGFSIKKNNQTYYLADTSVSKIDKEFGTSYSSRKPVQQVKKDGGEASKGKVVEESKAPETPKIRQAQVGDKVIVPSDAQMFVGTWDNKAKKFKDETPTKYNGTWYGFPTASWSSTHREAGGIMYIKGKQNINGENYYWFGIRNKSVDANMMMLDAEMLIKGTALATDSTNTQYFTFDTGGYTGEWDSSGRVAMLHQKEIVLNAHDTENFLAGINILRDITAAIDLQALSQRRMLSSLSSSSIGTQSQVLEQQVTITAEFPNATERSEIEAAFDSLLNRASQFANRKK